MTLGVYYAAPLLGPSLGPLLGGVVTDTWNWRATFYLLAILGGISLCSFFFFTDTFRQERSLTYQAAKERATERVLRKAERQLAKQAGDPEKSFMPVFVDPSIVEVSILDLNPLAPIWSIIKRKNNIFILLPTGGCSRPANLPSLTSVLSNTIRFPVQRVLHYFHQVLRTSVRFQCSSNRFRPTVLWFGYVAPRKGHFIGSVCSTGNMFGNIIGGRWSDYTLAKLKEKNGGKGVPEVITRFNSSS
jgi:MFS family permease